MRIEQGQETGRAEEAATLTDPSLLQKRFDFCNFIQRSAQDTGEETQPMFNKMDDQTELDLAVSYSSPLTCTRPQRQPWPWCRVLAVWCGNKERLQREESVTD